MLALRKSQVVDLFVVAIDDTLAPADLVPNKRNLRAPDKMPLKKVEILHRPQQSAWVRDDSIRANTLLAGLSEYLRTRDPK